MELVIVVPVLMMIVLFVVWAGRVGNAGLAADLAAEEAAVAAALTLPNDNQNAQETREDVVRDLLELRPDLDYLCIDGPQPGAAGKYVTEVEREFEAEGVKRTIGLVGVTLRCETDGAVPVLRGLAPTVVHYGRGSEPFLEASTSPLPQVLVRDIAVLEGPERDTYQDTLGLNSMLVDVALTQPVTGDSVQIVATTASRSAVGGDDFGRGGCDLPAAAQHYYDYRNTSFSGLITAGNSRISIPITIIDDCIDEGNETFVIDLTATNAIFQDDIDQIRVTIIDTDPTPLIGFVTPDPATNPSCFDSASREYLLDEGDPPSGHPREGMPCTEIDLALQLRNPYDSHHDELTFTGRSRDTGQARFQVESLDRDDTNSAVTAADDDSPHPTLDCGVGDFTKYEEDIEISHAFDVNPSPGDLPRNSLAGYNDFVRTVSLELRHMEIRDDSIFEPEETLVFRLTSSTNVNRLVDVAQPPTVNRYFNQINVRIIDHDPPPVVEASIVKPSSGGTTIPVSRGRFKDPTFELAAMVMIPSSSPILMSQAAFDVKFVIKADFSDDPMTSTVDDPIADVEILRDAADFPGCATASAEIDLKTAVTEFMSGPHASGIVYPIDTLTEITFMLESPPNAVPTGFSNLPYKLDPASPTYTINITDP